MENSASFIYHWHSTALMLGFSCFNLTPMMDSIYLTYLISTHCKDKNRTAQYGNKSVIFKRWHHVMSNHDSSENLDNFSLIMCLFMHRWCLHGPINLYHSFWWSNLMLCLYSVDTLNIGMKKFCFEKKMTKWQLWELWTYAWKSLVQKIFFWQNDSSENLDNFPNMGFVYA